MPGDVVASVPAIAGGVVATVAVGGYLALRSVSSNITRDVSILFKMGRMARRGKALANAQRSIADYVEDLADNTPDRDALVFVENGATYTWKLFDTLANQVANWGIQAGIKKGDVVALMMDNRAEFLIYTIGLLKLGAVVSMINTALMGFPLKHSLSVCKANHFFIGSEHVDEVTKVRFEEGSSLKGDYKWYVIGANTPDYTHLDPIIAAQPTKRPSRKVRAGLTMNDTAVYVYTSGTTGAPKPSVIKHIRIMLAGMGFGTACDIVPEDRIYCALPLYHSAALFIGFGSVLVAGCTMVIRRRFSASAFFKDCTLHKCSMAQYIGELCRYLLNSPPSPYDKLHQVRGMIGNGLRPEIWRAFQQRFNEPQMYEFYGSTEGNSTFINMLNKEGAVGFVSPLMRKFLPIKIVKFDINTEQPVRDKNGFCIECAPGESGEMIGKIENGDPTREFVGYTEKSATEKKILHNVSVKGDSWFRSGDLLRFDEEGFLFFVDRIGDTFRWKGENVATSEVSQVISEKVPGILEVNVYGVSIPHKDGRAGMASLVVNDQFSLETLFKECSKNLPKYAAPVFVRIQNEMIITATFKNKKVEMVQEGFDIDKIQDKIYFRDDSAGKFVPLTPELYQMFQNNQMAKL